MPIINIWLSKEDVIKVKELAKKESVSSSDFLINVITKFLKETNGN